MATVAPYLEAIEGKREQYCEEYYEQLIDSEKITKKEAKEHQNLVYIRVESILNLHDPLILYGIYKQYQLKHMDCEDRSRLCRLHRVYKFNKSDVQCMFEILSRTIPKKRCLCFYGPSNTGKSLLANGLLYPFAPGYIQRDGGTNVHWLEHIYRKSFILWEEPSIHMTNIEDTKLLLGGERIAINRKNKKIIERINDPAVIVTTNRSFWEYDKNALLNRMTVYTLSVPISAYVKEYITPVDIITYLCCVYDGRFSARQS